MMRRLVSTLMLLAGTCGAHLDALLSRAASLGSEYISRQSPKSDRLIGVIPADTLTHFCIVTGYDSFEETLATYGKFLGVTPPASNGTAGGIESNGTYLGQPLIGTTKIAFMSLNNRTQMEFLAGDGNPSWWRDVYRIKGMEVHHMGYALPSGNQIWPVVNAFSAAGLGPWVQYGRWGTINTPGSGCYVYMDSQSTLGVTVELLASESDCDSLPAPPKRA